MENKYINVAKDFSETPGARHYDDGPFSGEEFYDKILKFKFQEALNSKSKLVINLDGTYGYATSFISESFGRLIKDYGKKLVTENIEIVSEEDPEIRDFALDIISTDSL